VIAEASGTSLLHAGRLERHLGLRSLGGPERTAARLALEGARNRGADDANPGLPSPYVASYGWVAFAIAAKSRTGLLTSRGLKPPIELRAQTTQRAFV
jgi:hypothetical protein